MLNRWSMPLLLVGAVAGYASASGGVRAQGDALPFNLGDTVTLHYKPGAGASGADQVQCTVQEIRGSFVKCGPDRRFETQRVEHWRSLKYVVHIVKRDS